MISTSDLAALESLHLVRARLLSAARDLRLIPPHVAAGIAPQFGTWLASSVATLEHLDRLALVAILAGFSEAPPPGPGPDLASIDGETA